MENYKLINENKKLQWRMIEDINWGKLIQENNEHPYDKVGEFCLNNYSLKEIILLQNFVVEKRKELQDKLKDKIQFVSDDSFWDLCSHIVGLGESVYNLCIKYPEIAQILINDKKENFEYGFTKATYELQMINND
jgi:hypothetical protein